MSGVTQWEGSEEGKGKRETSRGGHSGGAFALHSPALIAGLLASSYSTETEL